MEAGPALAGEIGRAGLVLLQQFAEEAEAVGRYFPLLGRVSVGAGAEPQKDSVLEKLKTISSHMTFRDVNATISL